MLTFVFHLKDKRSWQQKHPEELVHHILMAQARFKVIGFGVQIAKFEKKLSVQGRGPSTRKNYSQYLAKMALARWNCRNPISEPKILNKAIGYKIGFSGQRSLSQVPFNRVFMACVGEKPRKQGCYLRGIFLLGLTIGF
jgi:hypothetical protein